ncbi:sodium:proton antiporter [Candidatus Dojkabacteria bacterium]|uniref:Sodium:proton antiporter n=1 Tax=Candidatus Dojkabacteria bacterium TaxID=2099670 RepID=A0A955L8D8_9BACT|nr:sodium:proton antiporter [Candidatus Dojkabacteria bacterium]
MHSEIYLEIVLAFSAMLLLASILFLFAKKLKFIPFPVLLVLAGLLLAPLNLELLSSFKLTPGLVLFILLPILLFESAFNFDSRVFKKIALPAFLIASIGLILSTIIVALPLYFIFDIPFLASFLLGSIVSSTDPVAILTILKKMGVPLKLNLLIDAESFFNDGTSLVLFKIVSLLLLQTSTNSSVSSMVIQGFGSFIYITLGGLIIGALLGILFSKIISFISDAHFVEIGLTIVLAFSSFIIAEEFLHVSGVISVLMAGLVLGNFGRNKISPRVFKQLTSIWHFLVFIATVVVFLLIGLKVNVALIFENWKIVSASIAAVLIARSTAVYSIGSIYNSFNESSNRLPMKWMHVINWGGLRGVLPLALSISLPDSFEFKDLFLIITYGIVLFTLFFNALSMKAVVKKLKLDSIDQTNQLEIIIIKLLITKQLLLHLDKLHTIKEITKEVYESQIKKVKKELKRLKDKFQHEYSIIPEEKYLYQTNKILLKYCLKTEKKTYESLYKKNVIGESIFSKLNAKIAQQIELIDLGKNQFKDKSSIEIETLVPHSERTFVHVLRDFIFGNSIDTIEEYYLYHKARFLGNEAVIDALDQFKAYDIYITTDEQVETVRETYEHLMEYNDATLYKLEQQFPSVTRTINECSCKAESHNLINELLTQYGEEERVSERALQNISITF